MNRNFRIATTNQPVPKRRFIDNVTVARRPVRPHLQAQQPSRLQPPEPQPVPVNQAQAAATTAAATQAPPRIYKKQFTPPTLKPRRWKRLQIPLIVCGAAVVGLGLQSEAFSIAIVCLYGLCAIWFRIPSRTTFALAALSVVAVVCLLLFRPDLELAGNFTTYTFLLLVTGVITLVVESKPLKRRKRGRLGRTG